MDVLGDGVERGEVAGVRGEPVAGCPCARRRRTVKQCSFDAPTMGQPTHRLFESTATVMEREEEAALGGQTHLKALRPPHTEASTKR